MIKMVVIGRVMVRHRPGIWDLWAGGSRICVFHPMAQWSWIICNEVRQLLVRGLPKEFRLDLHDLLSARVGGGQSGDSHRLFAIDRCELVVMIIMMIVMLLHEIPVEVHVMRFLHAYLVTMRHSIVARRVVRRSQGVWLLVRR